MAINEKSMCIKHWQLKWEHISTDENQMEFCARIQIHIASDATTAKTIKRPTKKIIKKQIHRAKRKKTLMNELNYDNLTGG